MLVDRVRDVRHNLLGLHKHLLDAERERHERVHGRTAPADFLRLLIDDDDFAWLRPLTALIVGVDEWLDDDERVPSDGAVWIEQVRVLLAPEPATNDFHARYAAMLQERPDIVLAHAAVTRALHAKRD